MAQNTPTRTHPTRLAAALRRLRGDTDGGGRYRCQACGKMVPLSHTCPRTTRSGFLDRYRTTRATSSLLTHSVEALRSDLA